MMARDELNLWRRSFCWTSGHGEGWALYAERLMDEFGFLEDAGDHLGMLDMQRMRAARVVFDIGYHCGFDAPASVGGGAWDPQKGYEFLPGTVVDIAGGELSVTQTLYSDAEIDRIFDELERMFDPELWQ